MAGARGGLRGLMAALAQLEHRMDLLRQYEDMLRRYTGKQAGYVSGVRQDSSSFLAYVRPFPQGEVAGLLFDLERLQQTLGGSQAGQRLAERGFAFVLLATEGVNAFVEEFNDTVYLIEAAGKWTGALRLGIYTTDASEALDYYRKRNLAILSGIFVLAGFVALGGYMILRDSSREMRLARLRSEFVSNVSHELRTPLAAIRMNAETLVRGRYRSTEKHDSLLNNVMRESERLSRLVDNILTFSQIESGRKNYNFREVEPEHMVRATLEPFEAAEHIQDVRQLELKIDTVEQIRDGQRLQLELMAPVEPYRTTSASWHDRLERFSQNVTNQAMTIVRGLHMPGTKGRRYTSYAYRQPVIPYEYQRVAEVPMDWKFLLDLEDFDPPGIVKGKEYSQAGYDDNQWADIQIGQAWEDQGYDRYDLGAWYRAEIEVEVKDDGAPVYMGFGGVDLHGYVYLNGELIGAHHVWDQPFILDISEGVNRHGKNTVAIFVYDGAGMGGIYGTIDIHQPLGDTSLNQFIANRGGSVHNYTSRYEIPPNVFLVHAGKTYSESSPHENFSGLVGHSKQYASYASTAPHIPYAHRVIAAVPDQWKFNLDYGTLTAKQYAQYPRADYDDSNWPQIRIGQAWEDQGLPGYDEAAWYRATVEVEAEDDKLVYMAFGGVDKDAWVYVNGQLVGEHHIWDRPFIIDISDAVNYHGENLIAIRVYDGAGMGGIYGLINIHQLEGRTHSAK